MKIIEEETSLKSEEGVIAKIVYRHCFIMNITVEYYLN